MFLPSSSSTFTAATIHNCESCTPLITGNQIIGLRPIAACPIVPVPDRIAWATACDVPICVSG